MWWGWLKKNIINPLDKACNTFIWAAQQNEVKYLKCNGDKKWACNPTLIPWLSMINWMKRNGCYRHGCDAGKEWSNLNFAPIKTFWCRTKNFWEHADSHRNCVWNGMIFRCTICVRVYVWWLFPSHWVGDKCHVAKIDFKFLQYTALFRLQV